MSETAFPVSDIRTRALWLALATAGVALAGLVLLSEPADAQACGYVMTDNTSPGPGAPVFNYVDISSNGTTLSHGLDSAINVNIPWTAYYCGAYTSTLRTSSNGYICFDAGMSCTAYIPHTALPQTGSPNAAYGYWTDWYVGNCNGSSFPNCGTKWAVFGSPGSRVFVYSFKDVPFYSTGGAYSFQMKVYEATHCIETHYLNVAGQSTQRTIAGMEDMGGTAAITWQNVPAPGFSAANEVVRYCPGTPPPPPPPPPPPGCGYTITNPIPFNWDDISATGTPLSMYDLTTINVNLATQVSPPMTFNFCGIDYSLLRLVSKGYICLGSTASNCGTTYGAYYSMPSTSLPRPAIYGYFADLYPGGCQPTYSGQSCTYWQVLGTAPNRRFVYEFRNVPNYFGYNTPNAPDTTGPLTFEIKLFEGSNCIEVHYKVLNPGNSGRTLAGFQAPSGTVFWAYHNTNPGFNTVNPPGTRAWQACPQPQGPTATADPVTVAEDMPTAGLNVLANDLNPTGGTLSVTSVGTPTLGTATFTPSMVFYTPNPNAVGTDTFTYNITSSGGGNATGTITVTINPVNDPPSFTGGPAVEAAQEGPLLQVPGWGTQVAPGPADAVDEATQAVAFVRTTNSTIFAVQPTLERTLLATDLVPNPAAGEFAVLSFTPATDAWGTAPVCFIPYDSGGIATVTTSPNVVPPYSVAGDSSGSPVCLEVTVVPCNPVDDHYVAYTYWTLEIPGQDNPGQEFLLANDAGAPGAPVLLVVDTANGALNLLPSGGFTYLPDAGFPASGVGTDSFQYRMTCGTSVSRAVTATLEIRRNNPPVAAFSVGEDAIPGFEIPFVDASYDPDEALAILPPNRIVQWSWEFGDGTTSEERFPVHAFASPGSYQVKLTVRDNVGNASEAVQTVEVAYREPPAAEETKAAEGGLAANAGPDRTVRTGETVHLSGAHVGGGPGTRFLWTSAPGTDVRLRNASWAFPDFVAPPLPDGKPLDLVFGLTVTDGARRSPIDYVIVRVVSGNEAPIADAGGPYSVLAGETVVLEGSAVDADGDTLVFTWSQPEGAAVTLETGPDGTASFVAPSQPGVLRFRVSVADGSAVGEDEAIVVVRAAPAGASGALEPFAYAVTPTDGGALVRFTSVYPDAVWLFEDGHTETGSRVERMLATGSHTVTMQVGPAQDAQVVVVGSPAADAAAPASLAWLWLALAAVAVLGAAGFAAWRLRKA